MSDEKIQACRVGEVDGRHVHYHGCFRGQCREPNKHDGEILSNAVRPGQTGTWTEPVNVEYAKCGIATATVRSAP